MFNIEEFAIGSIVLNSVFKTHILFGIIGKIEKGTIVSLELDVLLTVRVALLYLNSNIHFSVFFKHRTIGDMDTAAPRATLQASIRLWFSPSPNRLVEKPLLLAV